MTHLLSLAVLLTMSLFFAQVRTIYTNLGNRKTDVEMRLLTLSFVQMVARNIRLNCKYPWGIVVALMTIQASNQRVRLFAPLIGLLQPPARHPRAVVDPRVVDKMNSKRLLGSSQAMHQILLSHSKALRLTVVEPNQTC